MRARPFLIAMTCVGMLRPSSAANAQHFPSNEEILALSRDRVNRAGVGGIVVGVLEADGTRRIVAYGDSGHGTQLSGKSLFEIGSITKVFAGVLLSEMASRGEVSLSDPAVDYLPEGVSLPDWNGRQITLLDLATHHSGLPNLPLDWPQHSGFDARPEYTPTQLYEFLSAYQLSREPGSDYEYSNIGVGLLGHILARVGGGNFEEVVRERILAPLKMSLTGTKRDGERSVWLTVGHDRAGSVAPYRDFPHFPAMGGLRSNVDELLLFLDANAGSPRTPLERVIRESHQVRKQYSPERGVAVNWFVWMVGDGRIIGHGGATLGYEAFIGFDPEAGVGAVVLANSRGAVHDLGMHLINAKSPLAGASTVPTRTAFAAFIALLAVALVVASRKMRIAKRLLPEHHSAARPRSGKFRQ